MFVLNVDVKYDQLLSTHIELNVLCDHLLTLSTAEWTSFV